MYVKKRDQRPLRVKAFMKQAVGSPFWNLGEHRTSNSEVDIAKAVASTSAEYGYNPMNLSSFTKIEEILHARVYWRRCSSSSKID